MIQVTINLSEVIFYFPPTYCFGHADLSAVFQTLYKQALASESFIQSSFA